MKQLLFIIAIACFSATRVHAQTSDTILERTVRPVIVEAQFPGGVTAWRTYLAEKMNNSVALKNKAPKGVYRVLASFNVNKEGKVTDVKILADPGYGTGDDFKAVLLQSPKWSPATQDGKPVTYQQRQTLTYQVQ
ncbi:energy transducer TonB [Deminuibacter soli]|uniref:TonB C-terminal domain-containing protein n=1 Tax=Deminuibacter soli TaxID=2291815 RepID=A0A3E1NET0_9BACT|nr:hypothetical protein [Deminuibacter soli]RFM26486.1 hypothetical protein DXN05_19880 [Deminuibacter soli]